MNFRLLLVLDFCFKGLHCATQLFDGYNLKFDGAELLYIPCMHITLSRSILNQTDDSATLCR